MVSIYDQIEDPEEAKRIQDLIVLLSNSISGVAHKSSISDAINRSREHVRDWKTHQSLGISNDSDDTAGEFDFELNSLWTRAETLYSQDHIKKALPIITGRLGDKTASERINRYYSACIALLRQNVIPVIQDHEDAGDCSYTHVSDMLQGDDAFIRSGFLDGNEAPPQTIFAYIGMFGLLIKAKKLHQKNEFNQAYSYLLKASRLIGMQEGAAFLTDRLDLIVRSLHARNSAHIKHARYQEISSRVQDLFHSLKRIENNLPMPWRNATVAAKKIYAFLQDESRDGSIDDPGIAHSSVYTICKAMCNIEKQAASGKKNFRLIYKIPLPDGSTFDIHIDRSLFEPSKKK